MTCQLIPHTDVITVQTQQVEVCFSSYINTQVTIWQVAKDKLVWRVKLCSYWSAPRETTLFFTINNSYKALSLCGPLKWGFWTKPGLNYKVSMTPHSFNSTDGNTSESLLLYKNRSIVSWSKLPLKSNFPANTDFIFIILRSSRPHQPHTAL